MVAVPPFRVLVLCTANRCRSPLLAAMLGRATAERGLPVVVTSAGLRSPGHPVEPGSRDQAALRGLDLGDHVSRRVEAADLEAADLVLTAGFTQLRDAVALQTSCWPRTFAVRDFVRRAQRIRPPATLGLPERVQQLHLGRRTSDLVRAGTNDDVPDPMGGPPSAFAAMGQEFDVLVPALVAALAGAEDLRTPVTGGN